MSFDTDIDMKSYAGATKGPAAADQPDTNSYMNEVHTEEFPVQQELLENNDQLADARNEIKSEVNEQPTRQELNFQSLREEVDRLKAEREREKQEHQLQLDIFRANLAQQNAPKPQPEKKMFEGMQDDDIPNVSELRREWNQREVMYQQKLEELQVAQQYPDYAEVISNYALPLVKQKPHLAQGLNGAENKALFAYELGKMAQKMQMQQPVPGAPTPQPNANAQRMVENSRKPASLAQAGGQNVLGQADYYASMSDAEFVKFASRHME